MLVGGIRSPEVSDNLTLATLGGSSLLWRSWGWQKHWLLSFVSFFLIPLRFCNPNGGIFGRKHPKHFLPTSGEILKLKPPRIHPYPSDVENFFSGKLPKRCTSAATSPFWKALMVALFNYNKLPVAALGWQHMPCAHRWCHHCKGRTVQPPCTRRRMKWFALKPGWFVLKPGWFVLKPGWFVLKPGLLMRWIWSKRLQLTSLMTSKSKCSNGDC